MERFFLQTSLGLEFVTAEQLSQLQPQVTTGGVEIECDLAQGFSFNQSLRTVNRVLLRIGEFKAKDFPQLYQRVQKLPWRKFVEAGDVTFEVATHGSRLKIKERIAQTCSEAYADFHKGHEPKAGASRHKLEVFVRLQDDVATFSVNTSGDVLYKRGEKSFSVEAPLRETMAACLVRLMAQNVHERIEWIDPMAGSGTLILEAAARHERVTTRRFAFQEWPVFRDLKNEYEKLVVSPQTLISPDTFRASDIAPKAVEALTQNLKDRKVSVNEEDLFEGTAAAPAKTQRFVITNPPYGERLPEVDFNKLIQRIIEKYAPDKIGILLPIGNLKKTNYRQVQAVPFRHGGLAVTFFVLQK